MTAQITAYLIILRPAALAVVAMTAAAYPVLLLCIRRLQVKGRGTRLAGLFVGLSGRSALHLSCAWVKFAFFLACLLLARTVQPVHYLLLILLTAATLLLNLRLSTALTEVGGEGALLAGLFVCTTLLQYLRQIRYDSVISAAYWMLTGFLALCAAAVLLREVAVISEERNYFDETGETE